ncbi:MAG: VOC family protein [Sciscionella sp.]
MVNRLFIASDLIAALVGRKMGPDGADETAKIKFPEDISPIFPTTDIERAVRHYEALGFSVSWDRVGTKDNLWGYAFARRNGLGLHLMEQWDFDPEDNQHQAYIATPDPDTLADEWIATGVGSTHRPEKTVLGYQGVHFDPDYNRIRFGIPPVLPGNE